MSDHHHTTPPCRPPWPPSPLSELCQRLRGLAGELTAISTRPSPRSHRGWVARRDYPYHLAARSTHARQPGRVPADRLLVDSFLLPSTLLSARRKGREASEPAQRQGGCPEGTTLWRGAWGGGSPSEGKTMPYPPRFAPSLRASACRCRNVLITGGTDWTWRAYAPLRRHAWRRCSDSSIPTMRPKISA